MLNDLLKIEDQSQWKIKFNIFNGTTDPMVEYTKNPEIVNTQWLFWRTDRRYFNVGQTVICMLKIGHNLWLLTTIKHITNELDVKNGINYEGNEINEYSKYYGRVIVKYHKTFQSMVRWTSGILDDFEVLQVLPSVFDGIDFPGYDQTSLTFEQLEGIIIRNKRDWVNALENQKAVYLIRDNSNGKSYVGSATGDNGMLLQRWRNYVANGHGENVELLNIVNDPDKGFTHIKNNFTYSILENYNSRVDKNYILQRESWWKTVLGSRAPYGYNLN